jgi:uncharacterized membrane protein
MSCSTPIALSLVRAIAPLTLAFCAVLTGSSAGGQIPCEYIVTDIISTPPCGIFQSAPTLGAISPNGEYVVGTYSCIGGDERGFIYRTATNQFSTMPMPPGISSLWAFDVNDSGKIAGSMDGIGTGQSGFIYDLNAGQYETLIPPVVPGGQSALTGINAGGWACGYRTISEPILDIINSAIVVSPRGAVTDLGVMNGPRSEATDITDNNIVVGWTGDGLLVTGTQGFLWQNEQHTIMDAIPGGLSSAALATNDVPQVLLWGHFQQSPGGPNRTYLWENGQMTDIGILPGFQRTGARSINASSVVVGNCNNPSPPPVPAGFVWHAGIMRPLEDLISDTAGLTRLLGTRINDRGEIIGLARTSTELNVAFVATPVDRTPGDTDCDQVINIDDLLHVINSWGPCEHCPADLTGEGIVNIHDLIMVIENWTVP